MDRFTRGIATASARHPWRTIASWVLVLGTVFLLAASGGGTFTDDFSSPGSQSARAMALLDESFPDAAKGTALVVLEAEEGTTLDDQRGRVATLLGDVGALDHVASVADPYEAGTISSWCLHARRGGGERSSHHLVSDRVIFSACRRGRADRAGAPCRWPRADC
jgi:putative drug exporter of the RND superfamily